MLMIIRIRAAVAMMLGKKVVHIPRQGKKMQTSSNEILEVTQYANDTDGGWLVSCPHCNRLMALEAGPVLGEQYRDQICGGWLQVSRVAVQVQNVIADQEWITLSSPNDKNLPDFAVTVQCKVQHWHTKGIREVSLVRVPEDDCNWRTADDGSELSHDWSVVAWRKP
jgi:hypothetical protein